MSELDDAMQAVAHGTATFAEAEVLSFEVAHLRARVAALEAGQVSTEWGVRGNGGNITNFYSESAAYHCVRTLGPKRARTVVRRWIGPWVDAEPAGETS